MFHEPLIVVNWSSYFSLMGDKILPLKAKGISDILMCPLLSRVDPPFLRKDACYRVTFTEDDIPKILSKLENRQRLVSLGIFDSLPTDDEVRTLLTYVFFLPKSNLASYSNEFVRNLRKYPSIGVQIRTGGALASDNESNVFFSQSTMYRVIDMINKVLTENYIYDYNLFVSTDSQEILTQLKSIFPQLMHTSDDFKIGHTSNLRSPDGSNHGQRALIDLLVLSNCDYLIYTEDSSYGRLASALSFSEKKYYVSHKQCSVCCGTNIQVGKFLTSRSLGVLHRAKHSPQAGSVSEGLHSFEGDEPMLLVEPQVLFL